VGAIGEPKREIFIPPPEEPARPATAPEPETRPAVPEPAVPEPLVPAGS
jgi:hypothetical protein